MVITIVAVEDPSTRIVGFEVDIDRRQRWQQDGVSAARQPMGAHRARPPDQEAKILISSRNSSSRAGGLWYEI